MTSPRKECTCGGCGAVYARAAWRTLDPVATLGEVDVRRHVVAWPEGQAIEVRECRRCGHGMARLGAKHDEALAAAE